MADSTARIKAHQPAPEPPATPCLSDDEVLSFATGRLQASRIQAAHLHLDECDTCQRLLNEAAHSLATAATAPLDESEDVGWNRTFRPGTLVGQRYLIVQFIARGGMGEVYEAFDRELQERVALKTVTSTACDNPRAVRRLKAEVQLARRVSHPNVCRIYDFGSHLMAQTGAQISFLTMEFVDGETLGQRVRLGGAVPIPEALGLARQMLRGLSAAHEAGVLHRDFKSDNVMLRAEAGDQCSPRILDFGLARAFDRDPGTGVSASNPTLVGTFEYIAPEQLEGKPHSTASDVYAFGIVWFEMLTGELPFESSSSPAVGALERLHKEAPPPSSKNPLVSSELDALVLRCLRRSPKDRFRTPAEVLSALDALEIRTRFQARRLVPPAIAAGLSGIAVYLAVVAQPHKPTAQAPVRTLNLATPALPAPASPAPSEPAGKSPVSPGHAATDSRSNQPVRAARPASPEARAPVPPTVVAEQLMASGPTAPSASAKFPEPTPGPAPSAAHKQPGWEDPFGSSGPAEQLVAPHAR